MPAREPGEKPATSKQKDFLRHLIRVNERELDQLGKWQASWLIDSILEGQKKKEPVGCSVGIIVGACFVCWAAWRALY